MKTIECKTQRELEAALKAGDYPALIGDGYFEIYGSSQVTAYDSAQVTAYGSAQVTACGLAQVRAYGSSQVRAYGSAQVTACDSAQVRAYGSSQVRACDSSQVTASKWVAITRHGDTAVVDGGVLIQVPEIKTASEWCEFYGLPVENGIVTLYKGVNDDYTSPRGGNYAPGTMPVAEDWDGGKRECGGGLHFSPRAFMTLEFHSDAKRFMACPVRLEDIVVHCPATYPQKVKARGCCAPVYEVDIDGERIELKESK